MHTLYRYRLHLDNCISFSYSYSYSYSLKVRAWMHVQARTGLLSRIRTATIDLYTRDQ